MHGNDARIADTSFEYTLRHVEKFSRPRAPFYELL